jgi:hypothetical protein
MLAHEGRHHAAARMAGYVLRLHADFDTQVMADTQNAFDRAAALVGTSLAPAERAGLVAEGQALDDAAAQVWLLRSEPDTRDLAR